ncbi:hypothetical protein ACFPPA_18935 [Rhodanobacter ginsengisoli]|uniref:Uncharacterized protein n=1 Tax=Rhodanobacter ginsengisoli TaxID=418646 RepID=A0ABW0QUJ3_9GAMM
MKLKVAIAELGDIPRPLGVAAAASIVLSVVLLLTAIIPGADFNFAGTLMSHEAMWSSGEAAAILVSVPLMLAVGIGIVFRHGWVRPLLIVLPVLQYLPFQVVHWLFGAPNPTPSLLQYALGCGSWAAIAFVYLSVSVRAKGYFQSVRA